MKAVASALFNPPVLMAVVLLLYTCSLAYSCRKQSVQRAKDEALRAETRQYKEAQ